jgi:hypothetical protein
MNAQETMDNLRNFRVHFVSFHFTLCKVYTFHCHLLVPSSLSPTPAHRGPKGLKITNYSTARMITLLQLCAQATHNQKTLLEKQISPPHNPPSFLPPRHTCMQLFPFVGRARAHARQPARVSPFGMVRAAWLHVSRFPGLWKAKEGRKKQSEHPGWRS